MQDTGQIQLCRSDRDPRRRIYPPIAPPDPCPVSGPPASQEQPSGPLNKDHKFAPQNSLSVSASQTPDLISAPQKRNISAPQNHNSISAPHAPSPITAAQSPHPISANHAPRPISAPQSPHPFAANHLRHPISEHQSPNPTSASQVSSPISAPQTPYPVSAPPASYPLVTQAPYPVAQNHYRVSATQIRYPVPAPQGSSHRIPPHQGPYATPSHQITYSVGPHQVYPSSAPQPHYPVQAPYRATAPHHPQGQYHGSAAQSHQSVRPPQFYYPVSSPQSHHPVSSSRPHYPVSVAQSSFPVMPQSAAPQSHHPVSAAQHLAQPAFPVAAPQFAPPKSAQPQVPCPTSVSQVTGIIESSEVSFEASAPRINGVKGKGRYRANLRKAIAQNANGYRANGYKAYVPGFGIVARLPKSLKSFRCGAPRNGELTVDSLEAEEESRKRTAEDLDEDSELLKKRRLTPEEADLQRSLERCSKYGNVQEALAIYDRTLSEGLLKLNQYHYNILLYLCSSASLGSLLPGKSGCRRRSSDPRLPRKNGEVLRGSMAGLLGDNELGLSQEVMEMVQNRGFEVFEQMKTEGVPPNEATFTSVARLAVAKRDGELAFQMVKETEAAGMTIRLRSYGPALYVFYQNNDYEKAFEVDSHMLAHGVKPEESELEVLLQLSVNAGLKDKVYSLLHRLRTTVRAVSPSVVAIIDKWFNNDVATGAVKEVAYSVGQIKETIVSRGGGWHGLGWLGAGKWKSAYTKLNKMGVCQSCGEHLVTIDINPHETESFAESLAALAQKRESVNNNFKRFQEWVDDHGPYDAIVDGANIALYQPGHSNVKPLFSFEQLNTVVTAFQNRSPSKKLPLVVLHVNRTHGGPAAEAAAQELLHQWSKTNSLYISPSGSNDDWYWLYAAVRYRCLLVTNDEMRDHIFALLGNDFFPKWKERHQIRFEVSQRSAIFHMPPPYSIVIQESETGSWHVPSSDGDDITNPRSWLCVTRTSH